MSIRDFSRKMMARPRSAKRELIAVCVPCGRGATPATLTEMLIRAAELNADPDCPYQFARMILESTWRVDRVRNYFVQEVLKSEADRLFMIDDDMGPPDNWIDLLKIDADIVSGRYLMMKVDQKTGLIISSATDFMNRNRWEVHATEQAIVHRDAVGSGCVLIRRRVLEDERMILPTKYIDWMGREKDLRDEKGEPLPYFHWHHKPNGSADMGEDMDFCTRASALGYTVVADGRNRWDHYKNKIGLAMIEKYAEHYADFRAGVKERIEHQGKSVVGGA